MQIEVDPDLVEKHMEKAVTRISRQVKIPGFRPGKATRRVIEQRFGNAAILQEALEELVPEVYNQALESEQIDAIDQPEFDLESTEPLVVKAIVPVRPEIDLGDYQALRVPREEVSVSQEHVDEAIEAIRRQFAVLEPVERAVEWNDHVRADVKVQVQDHADEHEEEDAEFPVREGQVVSLPGFVDRLVGLEVGEHTIEFDLDADLPSEELAGKHVTYVVNLKEVKREILPDLDDEFVASLDEEGVETVDQLLQRIQSDLQKQFERQTQETYHNEVIDLLIARADLDYPDVLVNREVEREIDRQSNHASHTPEGLQNWLNAIGKTEEEVRDELREQADITVKRALVLGELIDAEKIEVTPEDIDAEIDSLVGQMGVPGQAGMNMDAIRNLFDTPDGRASIQNQLMTRKAVERIAEIAAQAEDGAGEGAPRASRRRRGATADAAASAAGEDASDDNAEAEGTGDDAEASTDE
ncbi:MAG: trigger factor [Chloroflexi bacterium]|nr:trigger factor [Chloroflexota bacterium]